MPADETLQVTIEGKVVQCATADDKVRLEPVGGILADDSTEGYRLEELQAMAAVLGKYDRPESLKHLNKLIERRTADRP